MNIRAILIVAALFAAFTIVGHPAADSTRDEDIKFRLRWMDKDIVKLEDRVNDLDQRVKALESRP